MPRSPEQLQQELREKYEREKAERFKDINVLDQKLRIQITSENVNNQNKYGTTILERAVCLDMIQGVEQLLQLGADPLIQDILGHSALYYAAAQGNLEILKLIVQNINHRSNTNIDFNKILTKRGAGLIHSACRGIKEGYHGCWKIIQYLIIEHSMDPWAQDNDGRTPNKNLQEYEPGYQDFLKKCYHDKYSKHLQKDHLITEHEFNETIRKVDSENVNDLKNGQTNLHLAIDHGCINDIKLLLELKADPLIKDSFSHTSLFKASMRGKDQVLRLLVDEVTRRVEYMEQDIAVTLDLNTILTSNKDSLIHGAILGINFHHEINSHDEINSHNEINSYWSIIEYLIDQKEMNPFLENDLHFAARDILNDVYVDQYDDLLEKLGCYL